MGTEAFDQAMMADEDRRKRELGKVIKEKYGGIHPLHGSFSGRPATYDIARNLPLDAYPGVPPHLGVDETYHEEIGMDGRDFTLMPQAHMERDLRYLKGQLNQEDLEAIDRRRHVALKEILSHNGIDTKEIGAFQGSKYPLTGPPLSFPAGHPRLQQGATVLLPMAPDLREEQLAADRAVLERMHVERMGGVNHLDALRAQVHAAQAEAENTRIRLGL